MPPTPKLAQPHDTLSPGKGHSTAVQAGSDVKPVSESEKQTVLPFTKTMSVRKQPPKKLEIAVHKTSFDKMSTASAPSLSPRKFDGPLPSFTNFIKSPDSLQKRQPLSPESMDDLPKSQAPPAKVPPTTASPQRRTAGGYRVATDNVILIDDSSSEDDEVYPAPSLPPSRIQAYSTRPAITDHVRTESTHSAVAKRFVCGFADPRLPNMCEIRFATQEERATHTRYAHGVIAEQFMAVSPTRSSRTIQGLAEAQKTKKSRDLSGSKQQIVRATPAPTPRQVSEEL